MTTKATDSLADLPPELLAVVVHDLMDRGEKAAYKRGYVDGLKHALHLTEMEGCRPYSIRLQLEAELRSRGWAAPLPVWMRVRMDDAGQPFLSRD